VSSEPGAGQLTETGFLRANGGVDCMIQVLPATVTFSPVGSCIYCGTTQGQLTDEHVIPFGLGGTLVLPKSSCKACAKETARLEQTIQRMLLGPFRIRLGLPTRRPKARPEELELQILRSGKLLKQHVKASEFPLIYHTVKLPPPRILSSLQPTDKLDCEAVAIMSDVDPKKYINKPGDAFSAGQFEPIVFYRFLAKIGHSFAIGRLGLNHFRSFFLRDIILGKADVPTNSLFQLIGGGPDISVSSSVDPTLRTLHSLRTRGEPAPSYRYVLAMIQLFSFLNAPSYDVIVGEFQGSRC
jgi:hypothetical protein